MLNSVKTRGLALLATVALLGGTAWIASGTTGAYFSDTHTGAISGSIGTITVHVDGGGTASAPGLHFTNLIPGTPQTVSVKYTNTGSSPQDVWIAFPNATALSALNNLGSYGSVSVSNTNASNHTVTVFQSSNLDDNLTECGGTFSSTPPLCNPLPKSVQVASSVAAGASGTVSFTFGYSIQLDNKSQNKPFNVYPASSGQYDHVSNRNGQLTINPSDETGTGLPYQIVATQVGSKL
jgi:hypothetical protein